MIMAVIIVVSMIVVSMIVAMSVIMVVVTVSVVIVMSVVNIVPVIVAVVVMLLVLAIVVPVIGVKMLFMHFIAMKVSFPTCVSAPIGSFASMRKRPSVSEPWIIATIHISTKAHWTAKPRTSTQENSSNKPLRSVIAEGRAGIRRVVEVSVGANRRHCNRRYYNRGYYNRNRHNRDAHLNMDADLCRCPLCASRNAKRSKSHHDTKLQSLHRSSTWIGE